MKTYIFRTTTTMKEYNAKHWWIDGNIVTEKAIAAETLVIGGVTVALIVILLFPFMVLAEILKNSK